MPLIRALQILTLSAFLIVGFESAAEEPAQPAPDKLVILSSENPELGGIAGEVRARSLRQNSFSIRRTLGGLTLKTSPEI